MPLPHQLARPLIENEFERQLARGDVAAVVAVGTLAKLIHVAQRRAGASAATAYHRLGVH